MNINKNKKLKLPKQFLQAKHFLIRKEAYQDRDI
jgi:hypothetical protein